MVVVNESFKKELMAMNPTDVTHDFFVKNFMDSYDRVNRKRVQSKHRMSDTFVLKAGEFHNKKQITTNVGLYIFNMYLYRDMWHVMEYVNEPVSKKGLSKSEKIISDALLTDKITPIVMGTYLDNIQWLSMKMHTMFSGSFTLESLKPNKKVIKLRDELLEENKEAISNGDVVVAAKIEKQLLEKAAEDLKGDTGMLLYDSGARGSFGNNFKNISVMKGPVVNPITGDFDIVKSNFMEGIAKEDLHVMGNSVVAGAYPKAVGTAKAGYFSKKIIAAMQGVVLDVPKSDCKTKMSLSIIISPSQANDYIYRYVVSGSSLVLLTPENISKYLDRPIKLRSVMYCIGEKVCSKCGGELNYMLGVTNLGLTSSRVSSTVLNMGMKKFHDSRASVITLDAQNLTR